MQDGSLLLRAEVLLAAASKELAALSDELEEVDGLHQLTEKQLYQLLEKDVMLDEQEERIVALHQEHMEVIATLRLEARALTQACTPVSTQEAGLQKETLSELNDTLSEPKENNALIIVPAYKVTEQPSHHGLVLAADGIEVPTGIVVAEAEAVSSKPMTTAMQVVVLLIGAEIFMHLVFGNSATCSVEWMFE
jgi:hypothetical protein